MSKKIGPWSYDFMMDFAQSHPIERLFRISQLETKMAEDSDLAALHDVLADIHDRLEAKGQ